MTTTSELVNYHHQLYCHISQVQKSDQDNNKHIALNALGSDFPLLLFPVD